MSKVMIVDDERGIQRSFGALMENMGHIVHTAGDVDSAIEVLTRVKPDVIVCDYIMPRKNGIELLRFVRDYNPDIQVIMISGEPTIKSTVQAIRLGAFDYMAKPISGRDLCQVVGQASKRKKEIDRAKRSQQVSEEKYRTVFETAIDGMIIIQDGVIKLVNVSFSELIGVPVNEIVGKPFGDFTMPEESRRLVDLFERYSGGERELGIIQMDVMCADGKIRNVEMNGGQMPLEGGMAILLIIRDVTELRTMVQALHESEAKYHALSEATFEGVILHKNGIIIHANQALENIFGMSEEEIVGRNVMSTLLTSESAEYALEKVNEGSCEPYEVTGVRKDGSEFPLQVQARNYSYKGEIYRVAAMRDMSSLSKHQN